MVASLVSRWRQVVDQQRLIHDCKKSGGQLVFDYEVACFTYGPYLRDPNIFSMPEIIPQPNAPLWMRKVLGDEPFRTISGAAFVCDRVPNWRSSMKKFPSLRYLCLFNATLDESDVTILAKMSNLEFLYLPSAKFEGEALKNLAKLDNLSELDLTDASLVEEDLATLVEMRQLKVLILPIDSISGEGVKLVRRALPACAVEIESSEWAPWAGRLSLP